MKQIIFLRWTIKSKAVWVSAISSMPPYSIIDSVPQQQDRTHGPFLASPTYCPFLWIRITQVPSPPLKAVLLRLENSVSVPLDPSAPYSEAGHAVPVSLVASVASVSLVLLLRQQVANNIWKCGRRGDHLRWIDHSQQHVLAIADYRCRRSINLRFDCQIKHSIHWAKERHLSSSVS